MTDRRAGFSLIEVVVALLIVSMIAVSGTALLVTTLNGKDQMAARADVLRELELARAVISADLAQIAWRPVRDEYGLPAEHVFYGDTQGEVLLAFSRGGWENPAAEEERGSIQYVEYRVEEDRLIRRTRLRADATDETPLVERVLLDGVSDVTIDFILGELVETNWEAALDGNLMESLPAIVAIDLELESVGRIRQLFLTPRGG